MANIPSSVGDWEPKTPTGDNKAKLFSPNARENSDSVNATNTLKNFVGKKGAQSEPLGKKGREF